MSKHMANPTVFGPGTWFAIHVYARAADTPQKIKEYILYLRLIVNTLPCGICREHANDYLSKSPPENFIDVKNKEGRLIGMFLHSWMFHNIVNVRLGKAPIKFETAWNMYSDKSNAICTKDCGNDLPVTNHYKITHKKNHWDRQTRN